MASPTASSPDKVTSTLYSSGRYSDLTIKCGSQTFNVHRAIVCLQSKVFSAAVDGKFEEASTGIVDLKADDPDVVEKMIAFMYNGTYDDERKTATTIEASDTVAATGLRQLGAPLLLNAKMYVIADKYDIQALKDQATKFYEEVLVDEWNSALFVASLDLLYEETIDTDRALKDIAMKAIGQHVKDLLDRGEVAELCKKNGEVAFDLLKASMALAPQSPQEPSSPSEWQTPRQTDKYSRKASKKQLNRDVTWGGFGYN